jgi:hypothetical protein
MRHWRSRSNDEHTRASAAPFARTVLRSQALIAAFPDPRDRDDNSRDLSRGSRAGTDPRDRERIDPRDVFILRRSEASTLPITPWRPQAPATT